MLLAACLIGLGPTGTAAQPANSCGMSPTDWGASPAGDPCGQHKTERDCRGDALCRGMPYRGESVIACIPDGKGFWENCPAVGCISR